MGALRQRLGASMANAVMMAVIDFKPCNTQHDTVKNPKWQEADLLAFYKRGRFDSGLLFKDKSNQWSEWGLDLGQLHSDPMS